MAQTVKNPPAMLEPQVLSLGGEDLLEKGIATHCSILAKRIPWTEEPGGLPSMGLQRVRHNRATNTSYPAHHILTRTLILHTHSLTHTHTHTHALTHSYTCTHTHIHTLTHTKKPRHGQVRKRAQGPTVVKGWSQDSNPVWPCPDE